MSHTPVYIICSPRPLVGKTLMARLLSEFLLLKNGTVVSFDVNLKEMRDQMEARRKGSS